MRRFKFRTQHSLEEAQVRPSPFGISKDEVKSIVRDKLYLGDFGGLYGIARSLGVSLEKGVSAYDQPPITERRDYNGGSNQCIVTSTKTSITLVVFLLAFSPVFVVYKGLGIMLIVTLVIIIAAFFLFKHYLIPEKKVSVTVAVIRNGISNAISTTDLVVGDIIQLYAGEKVPADGIFIPGRKLLICEPANLTGVEGGRVEICRERPHLPAGSTVLSGSAKMLVTAVGMNTAGEQMKPRYEHCMVLSGYLKMSALISKIKVAKENAGMTISVDHVTRALHVTRRGRAIRINIQKFVQFQLTAQLVALMFILSSTCISGSAPLLTIQLIWTNLVMDTLAALALAAEIPYHGMRSSTPVARGVSLITKAMWRNIIGQSIYQLTALLVFSFIGKQILELNGSAATEVLNAFIFNSFVFCQVFNEINSRDIYNINIFRGMSNNWIFVGITGSTVVFQVIMVEVSGHFCKSGTFKMATMATSNWICKPSRCTCFKVHTC